LNIAVIIVAAGRGTRFRSGDGPPKQYARLGPATVLSRTLRPFLRHSQVGTVTVVIHPDDIALYEAAVAGCGDRLRPPVAGGATRQGSVLAGLESLAVAAPDLVLIHDAARPFVSSGVIDRVLAQLASTQAAVPALPVIDTLKRAGPDGIIAETIARAGLWRAQTPQGFRFAPILAAHRAAAACGRADFTDDAAIGEWHGLAVALVAGEEANRKLTTTEDLMTADRQALEGAASEVRTGQGFDVHRFKAGDHVWLGGIRIAHSHALDGHSDADVALHALTDALLGAIGDGDIGQHFPPSDPQWKGAASDLFLADAAGRVARRGGEIVNADLTILCEAPRIAPHREAMRARIAEILGIDAGRIGVKATTTEGLGFTGRREGIAAMAIASVRLPCARPDPAA